MKKQISRHPAAPFFLLALAAAAFSGCAKSAQPGNASSAASTSGASAAPPQKAGQTPILSFADFALSEGGQIENDSQLLSEVKDTVGCDSDCAKHRQEFRYVVYVGKQIYEYWDLKKAETHTDFDALAHTLEQSIVTGTSMTSYYQILRRWAAAFHDGHVNAMYKADDSDYEVFTAPVRLEVLAPATDHEKVVVSQLLTTRGFSADQVDVRAGDEVLAVNGKPVHQALDEAEKFTSGSTARMRRSDSARRLVDVVGAEHGATPLVLKVQSPQGATAHEVTLYRTAELSVPPPKTFSGTVATPDTGADYFNAVVLPGTLGYLRIDAFEGTQDTTLLTESMKLLSGTRGLLIDVRRNGGGDQSGNVVLSRLATSAITRYRSSPRMSDYTIAMRPYYFGLSWTSGAIFADWKEERVEAANASDRYVDKPVVLLTGTDCFSACDTFTSALKVNRLATVVGEPTGGGTGQPLVFGLPLSGLSFRYGVVRGLTASGDALEGVGTQPDQLIERTQAERVSGHDQQLLSALTVLGRQIHERAVGTDAPSEAAIRSALMGIGPVWEQDADLSPSRSSNRALRRLSAVDEIEKR